MKINTAIYKYCSQVQGAEVKKENVCEQAMPA